MVASPAQRRRNGAVGAAGAHRGANRAPHSSQRRRDERRVAQGNAPCPPARRGADSTRCRCCHETVACGSRWLRAVPAVSTLEGRAFAHLRVQVAQTRFRPPPKRLLPVRHSATVHVGVLGGCGVLRFDDVFVNSNGTAFNESHVFAKDACGRGQWTREGGAVKTLRDPISFASGTRVSVHEHLVNLLPYEQEEAEQQVEEAEEAEMAERGLRGTDWVAQARLHNGKERLLERLLPALYLVATALMPAARQYPLLLRIEHVSPACAYTSSSMPAACAASPPPAARAPPTPSGWPSAATTCCPPTASPSSPPPGPPASTRLRKQPLPRNPLPPAAHPLHHLAVGRTLPEDWVVVVSLLWSARVMDRGGGGLGDGNMRTAATWHTEEAMEAIAGMLRELYSEERVVVDEEHLPLRKAKALFSQTILLVGPTSPALSNLIFMPFNSTVIEILSYVVNGTLESSKSTVENFQGDGKSGRRLSSQQSTATWHYRLSERVGVHHLLSVCDPERNHMDASKMCHVD
ncbi:unnamed protein product [Closterium sp. Naga37s-1]|nr:unnamed protein product [Closterium sp. Naga37s-1]